MPPKSNSDAPSRREFLSAAGIAAATAVTGLPHSVVADPPPRAAVPADSRRPRRVLRIAHLTDVHVQPERKGGEGLTACLRHLRSQSDKPDVVLNGGDSIMDSFQADEARTRLQWDLWHRIWKDECAIPVEHCIGNHDIWGWARKDSRTTGSERLYGKKWAMEAFGISRPYRSFDRAGWHLIVLDSTFPFGESYKARLDDEQLEWLAGDLSRVAGGTPILVLSHIPILSASAFLDGSNEKTGNWRVGGNLMHIDCRRIKDLFLRHPNVRLCLSGHLHLIERVEYLGVTYLCNGAVSGAWWKGPHQECENGYALVNLYADGSFDREYVTYGWKASPDA